MSAAVHLVFQLGHFKAKRQFFIYTRDAISDDLEHVHRRYFPGRSMTEVKGLSKPTRIEHQQIILKLFGYRQCSPNLKAELEEKARRAALLSTQPIFILREILQHLTNHRIVAPGWLGVRIPA